MGGGVFLALLVILSWVPQSCPVLRHALVGCPGPRLAFQSAEEKEINRIPHQDIRTSEVNINVKPQENRQKTRVTFAYQAPEGTQATLLIDAGNERQEIATITHPLLKDIPWSRLSNKAPDASLFTKDEVASSSIQTYLASQPNKVVADVAAVKAFALPAGTYVPLTEAKTLDDQSAILVSYLPPTKDGTWFWFEQEFNISSYQPNSEGNLQFFIRLNEAVSEAAPFRLGEFHVDYRS